MSNDRDTHEPQDHGHLHCPPGLERKEHHGKEPVCSTVEPTVDPVPEPSGMELSIVAMAGFLIGALLTSLLKKEDRRVR
jgi:hypothetical protein